MPCQIHVVRVEQTPTAVVRSHIKRETPAAFIPTAYDAVWSFIRSAGLPRPGRHVALYRDGGAVELGVEISAPFIGNARVLSSELPAGEVATTTLFGPYASLGEIHAEVRRWCDEHGHKRTGVFWDIYDRWEESWNTDRAKIRTNVFHLLEPSNTKIQTHSRQRDEPPLPLLAHGRSIQSTTPKLAA